MKLVELLPVINWSWRRLEKDFGLCAAQEIGERLYLRRVLLVTYSNPSKLESLNLRYLLSNSKSNLELNEILISSSVIQVGSLSARYLKTFLLSLLIRLERYVRRVSRFECPICTALTSILVMDFARIAVLIVLAVQ
jgi:hypothetical protein